MIDHLKVNSVFEKTDCDQLLISDPYAIYYLCGKLIFPGERFLGLLLTRRAKAVLFVNELFRFDENIGVNKVYLKDTDQLMEILKNYIHSDGVLGIDKTLQARFVLPMIQASLAKSFVDGSLPVDLTRSIKTQAEIEIMRESSRINDLAMEEFKKLVHVGVTETEIASQMLKIYESFGANGYSFEPIVAFGDHAADPHHMPDDTALKTGDVVLFDVGCKYHDYCSDMTRTFFFQKEPNEIQKKIYNLVRTANEEAEKFVRPGVRLCDVDSVARNIITDGGYGPDFTHRLGHFIGLEDHEYLDVSQAFDRQVVPGNIFSIEPGIYHPGQMGCRIEDLILVTEDGHEVLNRYSKEIEIIG